MLQCLNCANQSLANSDLLAAWRASAMAVWYSSQLGSSWNFPAIANQDFLACTNDKSNVFNGYNL
jgi:hypothetical protein